MSGYCFVDILAIGITTLNVRLMLDLLSDISFECGGNKSIAYSCDDLTNWK